MAGTTAICVVADFRPIFYPHNRRCSQAAQRLEQSMKTVLFPAQEERK
jgi:hypothetical protein